MDRSVDLVVNLIEGRTDAVSSFDDVADGAGRMSRAVDDAGATSERNGKRFAVSAEGADTLATKSSIATGALGALSSGFELVGLEKYAAGLQQASLATDFFSGIGDSATLILESTRITNLRAAAASRVATVATRAQTVATRALNLVLRANPIGLVLTAVALLIGGFVLLYKRSETFRNIVDAVGRVGRAALQFIIQKATDLALWLREKVPAAVARLRAAFDTARDKAVAIGEKLLAPFRAVKDMIDRIISAISRIRLPKLPSVNLPGFRTAGGGEGARMAAPPAGRMAFAASTSSTSSSSSSSSSDAGLVINITGALDPDAVARQIERILGRRARRVGVV